MTPALHAKQLGLCLTEANNKALVKLARAIAREQCVKYGSTTIDSVRQDPRMAEFIPTSSAVWGSVFHGDEWVLLNWEPSTLKSNHARFIRRWRYEE
mgnify:FL=1